MNLPVGFGEVAERLRRNTVLIRSARGGQGSGFILDANGRILTNAHVVRSRQHVVQLWDGRSVPADLNKRDAQLDLALLTVSMTGLPAAALGDSRRVRVGEVVVAVGNPFGFLGAVTAGVVHAVGPLRRDDGREWIQSDLQLAPGNSGGPLANAAGEVIGVNTMVVGRLGIAVPANTIRRFISQGAPRRQLGVALRPVSVALSGQRTLGLLLLEIEEGSPASIAALMPGDIIIGTHDGSLNTIEDLHAALAGEGERVVRLLFLRGNRSEVRKATVLLGVKQNRAA